MKLRRNIQYSKVVTYGSPDRRSPYEKRHTSPNTIPMRKPTLGYAIIDNKYYVFRRKYKGKHTRYFGPFPSLADTFAFINRSSINRR